MGAILDLNIGLRSADKLRPYQAEEARRIADGQDRLMLFEPGAGKTAATGHGIAWRFPGDGLVVLISTNTIVRGVWQAELASWADTARIQYTAAVGTPAQRKALVQGAVAASGLRVIGATFDTAADLHALLQGVQIDVLVIDEISMARNVQSRRFRALIQLAARAGQRIGLTGSPTPNNIGDIFGVVGLVDLGKSLGSNAGTFRQNFMMKTGPKAWQVAEKPGARALVLDKIKHLVHVVRTADVVDGMPTLARTVVEVDLPAAAMQQYREVEAGLLNSDELHQDAVLVKCQQVANGRVLGVDGKLLEVHDAKLNAAVDLIDAILEAGEQVLVAFAFKADAAALMSHYPMQSLQFESARTEHCLRAWNEGQPIMLLHPRSAGHGLNLQHAPRGGHLIWLSATWSSELYEQTVARVYRPGQRRPVRVTLISAQGTIDEVVLKVLDRKIDAQLMVKAYLAERRAQGSGAQDLAARIKAARQAVSAAHPDHGGTDERFRAAWAALQDLLAQR
jgi:SNF2 family DNA or RNA helicase